MSMDKNSRTLKNNIIKKCFKNHFGVNFLQMSWQFITSLGSSIKVPFLADSVRILYLPMICSISESKDDPNFDLRVVNKIPGKCVDA